MDHKEDEYRSLPGWSTFLIAMFLATAIILIILRLVGPRVALSSAGTVVALILCWPVLVVVGGLILGLVASLLAGDDVGAGEAAELGVRGGYWYYKRLWSFKSPFFWGGILGASLSLVTLSVYIEKAIVPQESVARKQVRDVALEIRKHRQETGHFPEARGKTLHETLGLKASDKWKGNHLIDVWGNPLLYERKSDRYSEHFRITSLGWNGRRDSHSRTGDDIVQEGTAVSAGALTDQLLETGKRKLIDYVKKKLKTDERSVPSDRK